MARRPRSAAECVGGGYGLSQELRKFNTHRRQLNKILGETQKALKDVAHMNLFPLEAAISEAVKSSREGATRPPALVVLGPARARLVNLILGEKLLPSTDSPTSSCDGWRWLRLQHGTGIQIRLSLGTEFEIVEPLMSVDCNLRQIPHEHLQRSSNVLDSVTVLDIELCNPMLENGIQIIVPPDGADLIFSNKSSYEFVSETRPKDYEPFFSKRGSPLENVVPIIIYALDKFGMIDVSPSRTKVSKTTDQRNSKQKNNSSTLTEFIKYGARKQKRDDRNNCDNCSSSKFYVNFGEEPLDGCIDNSTDSLGVAFEAKEVTKSVSSDYGSQNGTLNTEKSDKTKTEEDTNVNFAGLSDERLLYLRQIFEIHPNARVLFTLFSDSKDTSNNSPCQLSLPQLRAVTNDDDCTSSGSLDSYSLYHSPMSISNYQQIDSEDTTSEYSSISPASDFGNKTGDFNMEKGRKILSKRRGSHGIPEEGTQLSGSVVSRDSVLFSMDEEKDKLLDRQRAYLAGLVEQLQLMSNPLAKNKFTGHWVIMDDSQTDDKENSVPSGNNARQSSASDSRGKVDGSGVLQRDDFIYNLVTFSKGCLQNYILEDCNKLSEIQNALLQQFILSSFDMAREMQIVPRRIQYVAEMEEQLYETLINKFTGEEKHEELLYIIQKLLDDMKNDINNIDWTGHDSSCRSNSEFVNLKSPPTLFYDYDNRIVPKDTRPLNPDIILNGNVRLSDRYWRPDIVENIADEYLKEYNVIDMPNKETRYFATGEEAREMVPLPYGNSSARDNSTHNNGFPNVISFNTKFNEDTEFSPKTSKSDLYVRPEEGNKGQSSLDSGKPFSASDSGNVTLDSMSHSNGQLTCSQMSFKQASLQVQRTVLARLSRNISVQLVKFVDCLRDSYFGTLQRCLETLEEGQCRRSASEAVRRILLVTRSVDLQQCASFSFLHAFVDQLKRFFHRLSLMSNGGRACCVDSPKWRKQVALDTVESLNAIKLAKLITSQLKDRVRVSHEQFQTALQTLSEHHTARLQQTEELKLAVRKLHAPRFARLYLEATSLADLVRYGAPHLGKEIGRGQYGVVYAVKGLWAGYEPVAVKSVVPPDERHFNELAMEFFQTRNIPPHERIVNLHGSIVDHSYGGGSLAVLLVSERLKWDLHCALMHANMTFAERMQVALDIVEGIRYLHSQGLVHRDIKLKNVLLEDGRHRAKLTDLGFCIPEAMMSGSIVGTPVHMAPELLSGLYDSSVDVYAFGVLFWYVCAGHVKIPCAFERFHNKEQLWCNVRKGLRPERLPIFSDKCWNLMQSCWSADPTKRPLLGDVQPVLEDARDHPELHEILYISS